VSTNGTKSENPLPVAFIGDDAALIKALEARGGRPSDAGAGAVVTMDSVGIGSIRSKSDDEATTGELQWFNFHRPGKFDLR
jgi:hypothetical protein